MYLYCFSFLSQIFFPGLQTLLNLFSDVVLYL